VHVKAAGGLSIWRRLVLLVRPLLDPLLVLPVWGAAWLLKGLRRVGLHHFPLVRGTLRRVGLLPVSDHYYEPLFLERQLSAPLTEPRVLPGVVWDAPGQLTRLAALTWGEELRTIPPAPSPTAPLAFYAENGAYEGGDADLWYQVLRWKKPRRVLEVGSGMSTRLAAMALARNAAEGQAAEHVCIEPYEMPWLEQLGVRVIRSRAEHVSLDQYLALQAGDVLFVDSSHVIRPRGDVLFLLLEVLPRLAPGVLVHVHDIFTPYDPPSAWVLDEMRLWHEQYLLEGLLTDTSRWRVLFGAHWLSREHPAALAQVAPLFTPRHAPGAIWLERVGQDGLGR
jgi:hypothetical protein